MCYDVTRAEFSLMSWGERGIILGVMAVLDGG